jgi:hypothetical protein
MDKVKDETRRARRHETQEVFTPATVVDYMLDKIPFEEFRPLDKTWLDNSCGNGNILERIILRRAKAQAELTDEAILKIYMTTFGTELMEDNTRECRQRLFRLALQDLGYRGDPVELSNILECNIVCTDTFKWNYEDWCPMVEAAQLKLL